MDKNCMLILTPFDLVWLTFVWHSSWKIVQTSFSKNVYQNVVLVKLLAIYWLYASSINGRVEILFHRSGWNLPWNLNFVTFFWKTRGHVEKWRIDWFQLKVYNFVGSVRRIVLKFNIEIKKTEMYQK